MKNVSFLRIVYVFCILALLSCSKDSEIVPCSAAWASDLQNELTAISTAVALYSVDQSAANCTALKVAYQGYIDALKPYGNCATLTGQDRVSWQNALNESEASIDAIIC
jgi:hypothetical protein